MAKTNLMLKSRMYVREESTILDRRSSGVEPTWRIDSQLACPKSGAIIKGYDKWLTLFVVSIFLFQALLIPSFLNPIRTPLRIAMFGMSIAMLFLIPGKIRWNTATMFGGLITVLFCIQLLNPSNNSFIAACASIGLNFAVLSPVFWCSKLRLNISNIGYLFFLLWALNSLSSIIGILEVYFPAVFSRDSKISTSLVGEYADGLKITLADGTNIYRPMGLTDTPGGAAASGFITILLATGLLIQNPAMWRKVMLFASIVAGLFCIYLCQVRSLLILSAIAISTILFVLSMKKQISRAAELLVAFPLLVLGTTTWAFTKGGEEVSNRIRTLGEDRAISVYYSNRGTFLEETIVNFLPEYPFGAGLGRWGMIYQYFGDKGSNAPGSLWAEIQPTAWLFDGGFLLLFVYYTFLVQILIQMTRISFRSNREVSDFAVVLLAYCIAILANTLSYVPFIGQAGLVFWLLFGAFYSCRSRSTLAGDWSLMRASSN